MEQRDLIKDQIEQMGKALARVLAGFLGLKSKGEALQGIEVSSEQLKGELDIDISKLMTLSKSKLKDYLKERKLTDQHLEILSELMVEMGESKIKSNKEEAKLHLEKAIELLDIANEISKTMSFTRITRKTNIENVLQQYK